eukprot:scaffold1136_cov399-Prasinococcus_capsulatus_cf.AAC.16
MGNAKEAGMLRWLLESLTTEGKACVRATPVSLGRTIEDASLPTGERDTLVCSNTRTEPRVRVRRPGLHQGAGRRDKCARQCGDPETAVVPWDHRCKEAQLDDSSAVYPRRQLIPAGASRRSSRPAAWEGLESIPPHLAPLHTHSYAAQASCLRTRAKAVPLNRTTPKLHDGYTTTPPAQRRPSARLPQAPACGRPIGTAWADRAPTAPASGATSWAPPSRRRPSRLRLLLLLLLLLLLMHSLRETRSSSSSRRMRPPTPMPPTSARAELGVWAGETRHRDQPGARSWTDSRSGRS